MDAMSASAHVCLGHFVNGDAVCGDVDAREASGVARGVAAGATSAAALSLLFRSLFRNLVVGVAVGGDASDRDASRVARGVAMNDALLAARIPTISCCVPKRCRTSKKNNLSLAELRKTQPVAGGPRNVLGMDFPWNGRILRPWNARPVSKKL